MVKERLKEGEWRRGNAASRDNNSAAGSKVNTDMLQAMRFLPL